jgi:hypothetical protein
MILKDQGEGVGINDPASNELVRPFEARAGGTFSSGEA